MDSGEIQRHLDELEAKAEHLRAMYEQYFMGIERLEPLVHRRGVEQRIKVLRKEQIRNTAQRFKFNTIVQRYSLMQQHWARVVRAIENGTHKRDLMRAAARFGDSAFAAVGAKKGKDAALAAAASGANAGAGNDYMELDPDPEPIEEPQALDLGADDLVEEEDDDEPATPVRLGSPVATPSPVAAVPVSPVASATATAAPRIGGLGALSQAARGRATGDAIPSPTSSSPAGLRGLAAQAQAQPGASPDATKKRVAELAAQARRVEPEPSKPGFGTLDVGLDFEPPPRPASPVTTGSQSASSSAVLRAPVATAGPSAPAKNAFGAIDIGFDAPHAPHAPQASPAPRAPQAVRASPAAASPPSDRTPTSQSKPRATGFGAIEIGLDLDEAPPKPGPVAPRLSPFAPRPAAAKPVPPKPAEPPAPLAPAARPVAPPVETKVAEPAPVEAKPAAPKPVEAKPAAPKPVEPRPVEPRAVEPRAAPAPPAAVKGDADERRMREIYDQYVATRKTTQESTGVTYEKLSASLRAQSEKLRAQHPNRKVDYEVVVKDGKAHLRPVVK